jgi:predicted phosphodiesterase
MRAKNNKMKLAFIGDVHLDDKNPRMRMDDYCVSIIKKLDYVLTWCRDNQVDKIILLGDLFHKSNVGGKARNLCVKLMKKHYAHPGAPQIYATIGNHDTGNDVHNIKSTTLWTLVQIGYVTICDYDPESRVAFKHHHVHIDEELEKTGLNHDEALIWSVHATITPTQRTYPVYFGNMPISGPSKLVICGHVHATYSSKRPDNRILINPGNIGRNKFLAQVPNQPVQFLVVEHDNINIGKMQYIDIETAQPYDKVFNLEKINTRKKILQQVRDLVLLSDSGEIESYTFSAIIELAKKQISSESVIELIAKYLGEANDQS